MTVASVPSMSGNCLVALSNPISIFYVNTYPTFISVLIYVYFLFYFILFFLFFFLTVVERRALHRGCRHEFFGGLYQREQDLQPRQFVRPRSPEQLGRPWTGVSHAVLGGSYNRSVTTYIYISLFL